jgi:hypothetical protein
MHVIPADTAAEAAQVLFATYRDMPPHRRLAQACALSDALREVTAAGVRSRHPEYDNEQVRLAVIRLALGEELFAKAYPGMCIRP